MRTLGVWICLVARFEFHDDEIHNVIGTNKHGLKTVSFALSKKDY